MNFLKIYKNLWFFIECLFVKIEVGDENENMKKFIRSNGYFINEFVILEKYCLLVYNWRERS